MKVILLSVVFSLELHVKDLVRVICVARLICSEINLCGWSLDRKFRVSLNFMFIVRNILTYTRKPSFITSTRIMTHIYKYIQTHTHICVFMHIYMYAFLEHR